MPPTDTTELRRLHEAATKGQNWQEEVLFAEACKLAIPALLDELEALREKVRLQALVIDELPEEVAGLHAVIELQREMIAHKDALTATPAQSLAAHDATLLREVAKLMDPDGGCYEALLAEADRIERGQNAK